MNPLQQAQFETSNPGRKLTYAYTISLSIIAILSIVVHVMLDRVIAQQSDTGKIVNISGQQRMLSQRVAMFTLEYLNLGSLEAKTIANEALDKMKQNHNFLLSAHNLSLVNQSPSPMSSELQRMYFSEPLKVDSQLAMFFRLVENSLKKTVPVNRVEDINVEFLAIAKQPLLDALNTVVSQYEKESYEKIKELRQAQRVVLYIIILTIMIEAFFVFRPMASKISILAAKLQHDASFDHLSGLLNRRAFYVFASKLLGSRQRYHRPVSVILFDIDHFKKVNDTYGHDVGDKAIKHFSEILISHSRSADYVGRFGGEEFVILLPETDVKGAMSFATKILLKIEQTPLQHDAQSITITASAGVAELQPEQDDIEVSLKHADKALYQSKLNGRNRVTVYTS